MRIYTYTYTHIYTHIYIYTYTHTHIYTHTITHMNIHRDNCFVKRFLVTANGTTTLSPCTYEDGSSALTMPELSETEAPTLNETAYYRQFFTNLTSYRCVCCRSGSGSGNDCRALHSEGCPILVVFVFKSVYGSVCACFSALCRLQMIYYVPTRSEPCSVLCCAVLASRSRDLGALGLKLAHTVHAHPVPSCVFFK